MMYVVSQLTFRTAEGAGEYQDHVLEESGFEAILRRVGSQYAVVTLVPVKNREEADAAAGFLRSLRWQGRQPQVIIHTVGGKIAPPPPEAVAIPAEYISDARRRYDESEKARKYREEFRKTEAFRESQRRYQQSAAGRTAQRKYAQSEKGRERRKAYQRSEKGKAARRAYQERRKAALQKLRDAGEL